MTYQKLIQTIHKECLHLSASAAVVLGTRFLALSASCSAREAGRLNSPGRMSVRTMVVQCIFVVEVWKWCGLLYSDGPRFSKLGLASLEIFQERVQSGD
jgi:hypothetical protein